MKNTLYNRYAAEKPCGVYAMLYGSGVVLYNPLACDQDIDVDFISAWREDGKTRGFHRCKVHYSTAGRAFIRKGGFRFYLDEFLRTGC